MKILNYRQLEPRPVDEEGACGTTIRWLIAKEDGAENFAMRLFELEEGGSTPFHTHAWEHEAFIIEGTGVVRLEEGEASIGPGTAVFVLPEEKHCFKNTGAGVMKILCMIPVLDG